MAQSRGAREMDASERRFTGRRPVGGTASRSRGTRAPAPWRRRAGWSTSAEKVRNRLGVASAHRPRRPLSTGGPEEDGVGAGPRGPFRRGDRGRVVLRQALPPRPLRQPDLRPAILSPRGEGRPNLGGRRARWCGPGFRSREEQKTADSAGFPPSCRLRLAPSTPKPLHDRRACRGPSTRAGSGRRDGRSEARSIPPAPPGRARGIAEGVALRRVDRRPAVSPRAGDIGSGRRPAVPGASGVGRWSSRRGLRDRWWRNGRGRHGGHPYYRRLINPPCV